MNEEHRQSHWAYLCIWVTSEVALSFAIYPFNITSSHPEAYVRTRVFNLEEFNPQHADLKSVSDLGSRHEECSGIWGAERPVTSGSTDQSCQVHQVIGAEVGKAWRWSKSCLSQCWQVAYAFVESVACFTDWTGFILGLTSFYWVVLCLPPFPWLLMLSLWWASSHT